MNIPEDWIYRKGARRISEVPEEILMALHAGKLETVNLTEWLAMDSRRFMDNMVRELKLEAHHDQLLLSATPLEEEGPSKRLVRIADALIKAFANDPAGTDKLAHLTSHTSDMARSWANGVWVRIPRISLEEKLEHSRAFAADEHFGVREFAWLLLRPFLMQEQELSIALLLPWTQDENPYLRRFAIEVMRPRGVWASHWSSLKADPTPALPLLENCRADTERYVQLSVANWLNDASKTQPDWVKDVCNRWKKESDARATRWIVNHAQRSMRKQNKG